MTPLGLEIAEAIRDDGPMRLDRYMALCLSHPSHGYYATRDPFGAKGDFVTAPEISQMFGELLGLWAAEVWRLMGSPARFLLIELGPGRGALMADMTRAGRVAPGFLNAAEVVLVETSPALREVQEKRLAKAGIPLRWAGTVDEALTCQNPSPGQGEGKGGVGSRMALDVQSPLPTSASPRPPSPLPRGRDEDPLPAIVISNEFFDALPIRQFVRADKGWRERLVGLDGDGRLAFGLSSEPPSDIDPPDAPEGAVREICAQALDITTRIAAHIAAHGGASLAVDYGYASGLGDTLQAVKAHAYADPLEAPGEADLTAHVDFSALAAAAARAGALPMALLSQADFLERLGLAARAHRLAENASPAQRIAIFEAAQRLTDRSPRGMGALFKALAIGDPQAGALPSFDVASAREA